MRFRDRQQAGIRLGAALGRFRGPDTVVVGLPRGGVPVAHEVAEALGAPLDVILVRKLGVPVQPEVAMGAIGEGGIEVLDDEVCRAASVTRAQIEEVAGREREELRRRAAFLRPRVPRLDLTGRTVLVVDDGIATGSTARAACLVARAHGAARVVLAAPVAPPDAARRVAAEADDVVTVLSPTGFVAVGASYDDFEPVSDETVLEVLLRARAEEPPGAAP
jgi:putative phosphoribosyl transferase